VAYEDTPVPVSQSQAAINKILLKHKVLGVSWTSNVRPVRSEGINFSIEQDGRVFTIRVVAHPKSSDPQEDRRIYRVLFYHIKGMFEAIDSKVLTFQEVFLPFVVTNSGKTVAEEMLPQFAALGAPPGLDRQLQEPKK